MDKSSLRIGILYFLVTITEILFLGIFDVESLIYVSMSNNYEQYKTLFNIFYVFFYIRTYTQSKILFVWTTMF